MPVFAQSAFNRAAGRDPESVIRLNTLRSQGLLDSDGYNLGLNAIMGNPEGPGFADDVITNFLHGVRQNPQILQNSANMEVARLYLPHASQRIDLDGAVAQAAQGYLEDSLAAASQRQLIKQEQMGQQSRYGTQLSAPPAGVFDAIKEARDVERAINVYNERPEIFSLENVRELSAMSQRYNIPFDPYPTPDHAVRLGAATEGGWQTMFDGASANSVISQFMTGAISGLTTVTPKNAKEPQAKVEEFARSLGHLFGFIGMGTGKSIPLSGAHALARGIGLDGVVQGLVRGASHGRLVKTAAAMAGGAFNLGVASAISAREGGPAAMLESALGGLVPGGFFPILRNVPGVGAKKQIITAMVGATYDSAGTFAEEGFSPQAVYDFLLGAYFGWQEGGVNVHGMPKAEELKYLKMLADRGEGAKVIVDMLRNQGYVPPNLSRLDLMQTQPNPQRGMRQDYAGQFKLFFTGTDATSETVMRAWAKSAGFKEDNLVAQSELLHEMDAIEGFLETTLKDVSKEKRKEYAKLVLKNRLAINELSVENNAPVEEALRKAAAASSTRLYQYWSNHLSQSGAVIVNLNGLKEGDSFEVFRKLANEAKTRSGVTEVGDERLDFTKMILNDTSSRPRFFISNGKTLIFDTVSGKFIEAKGDPTEATGDYAQGPSNAMVSVVAMDRVETGTVNDAISRVFESFASAGTQNRRLIARGLEPEPGNSTFDSEFNSAMLRVANNAATGMAFEFPGHRARISHNEDAVLVTMQRASGDGPMEAKALRDVADSLNESFAKKVGAGLAISVDPAQGAIRITRKYDVPMEQVVNSATVFEHLVTGYHGEKGFKGILPGVKYGHGVMVDPSFMMRGGIAPKEALRKSMADVGNVTPTAFVIRVKPMTISGDGPGAIYIDVTDNHVQIRIPKTETGDPVNRYKAEPEAWTLAQDLANRVAEGLLGGSVSMSTGEDIPYYMVDSPRRTSEYARQTDVSQFFGYLNKKVTTKDLFDIYELVAPRFGGMNVEFGMRVAPKPGADHGQIRWARPMDSVETWETTLNTREVLDYEGYRGAESTIGGLAVRVAETFYGKGFNTAEVWKDAHKAETSAEWMAMLGQRIGKTLSGDEIHAKIYYGSKQWAIRKALHAKRLAATPDVAKAIIAEEAMNARINVENIYTLMNRSLPSGVPTDRGKATRISVVFNEQKGFGDPGLREDDPHIFMQHGESLISYFETPEVSRAANRGKAPVSMAIDMSAQMFRLTEARMHFGTAAMYEGSVGYSSDGRVTTNVTFNKELNVGTLTRSGNEHRRIIRLGNMMQSLLYQGGSNRGFVPIALMSSPGKSEFGVVGWEKIENADAEMIAHFRKMGVDQWPGSSPKGFNYDLAIRAYEKMVESLTEGVKITDPVVLESLGSAEKSFEILKPIADMDVAKSIAFARMKAITLVDPGIISNPHVSGLLSGVDFNKRMGAFSGKKEFLNVPSLVEEMLRVRNPNMSREDLVIHRDHLLQTDEFKDGLLVDVMSDIRILKEMKEAGDIAGSTDSTTDGEAFITREMAEAIYRKMNPRELGKEAGRGYTIKAVVNLYGDIPHKPSMFVFGKLSLQVMTPQMEAIYRASTGKKNIPHIILTETTIKSMKLHGKDNAGRVSDRYANGMVKGIESHYKNFNGDKFLRAVTGEGIQFVFTEHDNAPKVPKQVANFIDANMTSFHNSRTGAEVDAREGTEFGGLMRSAARELAHNQDKAIARAMEELADPETFMNELKRRSLEDPTLSSFMDWAVIAGIDPRAPYFHATLAKALTSSLADSAYSLRLGKEDGVIGILSSEILGVNEMENGALAFKGEKIYNEKGEEIQVAGLQQRRRMTSTMDGKEFEFDVNVIDEGSVILGADAANRFKVGDKVVLIRTPINRGNGIVALTVAGFRGKDVGNGVIVSRKHAFGSFEGDLDIDKVFVLKTTKNVSFDALHALASHPEWGGYTNQLDESRSRVLTAIRKEGEGATVKYLEKGDDWTIDGTAFDFASMFKSTIYSGSSSNVIGQVANVMGLREALLNASRLVMLESDLAGKKLRFRMKEESEFTDVDDGYGRLRVKEYMGNLLQIALDDVKLGGVVGRRTYTYKGQKIENPYFFDRMAILGRLVQAQQFIDGKWVDVDGFSVVGAELMDRASRNLERKYSEYLTGKDPETGRTLEAGEVFAAIHQLDLLKTNAGARDEFFKAAFQSLPNAMERRVALDVNRLRLASGMNRFALPMEQPSTFLEDIVGDYIGGGKIGSYNELMASIKTFKTVWNSSDGELDGGLALKRAQEDAGRIAKGIERVSQDIEDLVRSEAAKLEARLPAGAVDAASKVIAQMNGTGLFFHLAGSKRKVVFGETNAPDKEISVSDAMRKARGSGATRGEFRFADGEYMLDATRQGKLLSADAERGWAEESHAIYRTLEYVRLGGLKMERFKQVSPLSGELSNLGWIHDAIVGHVEKRLTNELMGDIGDVIKISSGEIPMEGSRVMDKARSAILLADTVLGRDSDGNPILDAAYMPPGMKEFVKRLSEYAQGDLVVRRMLAAGSDKIKVEGSIAEDPLGRLLVGSKEVIAKAMPRVEETTRAAKKAADAARLEQLDYLKAKFPQLNQLIRSSDKVAKDLIAYTMRLTSSDAFYARGTTVSNELRQKLAIEMAKDDGDFSFLGNQTRQSVRQKLMEIPDYEIAQLSTQGLVKRMIENVIQSFSETSMAGRAPAGSVGMSKEDAKSVFNELLQMHAFSSVRVDTFPESGFVVSRHVADLVPLIVPKDVKSADANTFMSKFGVKMTAALGEAATREEAFRQKVPETPRVDDMDLSKIPKFEADIDPENMTMTIADGTVIDFKADSRLSKPEAVKMVRTFLDVLQKRPDVREYFPYIVQWYSTYSRDWSGDRRTAKLTDSRDLIRMMKGHGGMPSLERLITSPDPRTKYFFNSLSKGMALPDRVAKTLEGFYTLRPTYDSKKEFTGVEVVVPFTSMMDVANRTEQWRNSYSDTKNKAIEEITGDIVMLPYAEQNRIQRIAAGIMEGGDKLSVDYPEVEADRAWIQQNPEGFRRAQDMAMGFRKMLTESWSGDLLDHMERKTFIMPDGTRFGGGILGALSKMEALFGVTFDQAIKRTPRHEDNYYPHVNFDRKTEKEELWRAVNNHFGSLDEGARTKIFEDLLEKRDLAGVEHYYHTIQTPGAVNPNQRMASLLRRSDLKIKGYDMMAPRAIGTYYEQLGRKISNDELSLVASYVMLSIKTGKGDLGAKLKPLFDEAQKNVGDGIDVRDEWVKFMDKWTRNAIGYPSVSNEGFFGVDLNDATWAPRLASFMKLIGQKSKSPTNDLRWLAKVEGQYWLLSLLTFPKAIINNYFGANLNTIKDMNYDRWKTAGAVVKMVRQQIARSNLEEAVDIVLSKGAVVADPLDPKLRTDMIQQLRGILTSPGVLANFTRYEAELSSQYSKGQIRGAYDAIRGGMPIAEALKKHGIAKAMWDRAVEVGGGAVSKVEFAVRSRAFVTNFLYAREVMKLPPRESMDFALKGVKNTQFFYNAANSPEFRNSAMGKIVTRFQSWGWNQVRFESDIVREAQEMGWDPTTEEYQRYSRAMAINGTLLALAAFLPFSLFANAVPPPYQYGLELAQWAWDDDEKKKPFAGTFGISMLTGPTIYNTLVGPASTLITDGFAWNPYSLLPFGRSVGATVKTYKNPQYGLDMWFGTPFMGVRDLMKDDPEEEKKPRTIGGLWAERKEDDISADKEEEE